MATKTDSQKPNPDEPVECECFPGDMVADGETIRLWGYDFTGAGDGRVVGAIPMSDLENMMSAGRVKPVGSTDGDVKGLYWRGQYRAVLGKPPPRELTMEACRNAVNLARKPMKEGGKRDVEAGAKPILKGRRTS